MSNLAFALRSPSSLAGIHGASYLDDDLVAAVVDAVTALHGGDG